MQCVLSPQQDEKAFMSFWNKSVFLPPPDYASRRLIWPGLFERYGGRLGYEFDLSTLAHISEGYAAGSLDAVVGSMMTRRRLERLRMVAVDIPEILQWLSRVSKHAARVWVAPAVRCTLQRCLKSHNSAMHMLL